MDYYPLPKKDKKRSQPCVVRCGRRRLRPRETSLTTFEKLPKKGLRRLCHLRPWQTVKEARENIEKFLLPQLNTIYELTNHASLPPPREKEDRPRFSKWLLDNYHTEQRAKLKAICVLCEKNNDILEQFWKIPQQHA